MSSKAPMVHPFTFFLVNCIQIVYGNTSQGQLTDIRQATRSLYWLCICLDEKGQETLNKEIETMESVLDGFLELTHKTFRELFKTVMVELHKQGYFITAKFRPPTRETGMKDFELTTSKARLQNES